MSHSRTSLLVAVAVSVSFIFGKSSIALTDRTFPVDKLQEMISKAYRSKQAKTLGKAYQAYEDKNYKEAITLATQAQKDPLFSDYGYWIAASATRAKAQDLIDHHQYDLALKEIQKSIDFVLHIETTNPYSPFHRNTAKELASSELLEGRAYWGLKKWRRSEDFYERAFQRMQTIGNLARLDIEHVDHYAESCKKQTGALCMRWLQKFTTLYLKKSVEMKVISKYFPTLAENAIAFHPISKVTTTYKAPDLDQDAFDGAIKLFMSDKYSEAAEKFKKFLDDFPRSAQRFRVRYWYAQCLSRQKQEESAQKIYLELQKDSPLTYYGFLAAMASGKTDQLGIESDLPLASETDSALLPHESIHLQRAQKFLAEQANSLAIFELKELKPRDVMSNSFLVYLSALNFTAKNYTGCFQILTELIQRGYRGIFTAFGLSLIFPVEYMDLIKKYSTLNNLDPILVLSLIKQESAFSADVNSTAGALGLMQLMPATAFETDPSLKIGDLVVAEKNIQTGTKYLRRLISRFNGNIVLALAAYNAGPGAVDRWFREMTTKRDMLEFIENIPYRETREYVSGIIRNYFWYARRLNDAPSKSLSYFWTTYNQIESNKIKKVSIVRE